MESTLSCDVCDVIAGREERGERSLPEELRGQLVRHNPGLVLQEEALAGETQQNKLTRFLNTSISI